jgi:hypothetical protein
MEGLGVKQQLTRGVLSARILPMAKPLTPTINTPFIPASHLDPEISLRL